MLRGIGLNAINFVLPQAYTVDTLPDPLANLDRYARVVDLFGVKRDLVLASQDASGAYWQPVRPVYKGIIPLTGDTTLTALKSPSVVSVTGNISAGVTRNLTLSNQLVFPGAQFTIRTKLSSLLGALKVLDAVTGMLYGLALNTSYNFIYDSTNGWEQI